MKYIDFIKKFKDFNVISYQNIKNSFVDINFSQLSKWKKEKKIISLKRGYYVINENEIDSLLLANEINYSYISLEYALSYHQIIPDVAQTITSISKNRNEKIMNEYGNFHYRKIKGELFTGFVLLPSNIKEGRNIRIAESEKALFDLIYFRDDLKNKSDFDSLRLCLENLKIRNFKNYIKQVKAGQIKKRLNSFLDYYDTF